MKVLVVAAALLGMAAAGLPWGSPYACLNGLCGAPYAAGYSGLGLTRSAALPYAASWGATGLSPYSAASWNGLGLAMPYAARPLTYAAAVPAAATSTQYHAQDEFGQYKFGYSGPLSAKTEAMDALGATAGAYTYLDANGLQQTVKYVADANGFRVKATNLPVAPVANLVQPDNMLVGPAPVDDTPEVKAAKAEFQMKFDEAAAAAAAAPDSRRRRRSMPAMPEDTAEVAAAKKLHARLYNAEALRNSGVPVAVPQLLDTPAVMIAKARHAALYNQAALRAAAAPDYTSPYGYSAYPAAGYGLGLRSGFYGARRMFF